MATPHEEFFRLVREIRDILVEKDRTVMASVGSSRTVVNLGPVTASLNNLLSELETQTTTLSTLALDASVDGLEGFVDGVEALITSGNSLLSDIDTKTAAGNVDLAAMEILLTSIETLLTATNVDLAAIETLITAGNIDLAAIEVLLTTANSDRAANQVANQTDLDSLVSLITTANSNRTDDQAANQTDFNAMVTDLAALEALSTTLNSIQTDIKTLLTAGNVDLAALEVLAISIETALYSPNASGDEWLGDIQGSLGINGSIFGKLEDVEDALKQPITGLDWGGLLLIELGLILAQNVLLVADTTAQIVLMTAGNASLAAIALDADDIKDALEEASGGVEKASFSNTEKTLTIRPVAGTKIVLTYPRLTNNHATFPIAPKFSFSDGSTTYELFTGAALTPVGGTSIFSNKGSFGEYTLTNDKFLQIDLTIAADGNGFDFEYGWYSLVGASTPVHTFS